MKFIYLALFLWLLETIIFLILSKEKKEKLKKASMDALTFNSGLILFLYLLGKALEINYLSNIDEYSLGIAIGLSSLYLMSVSDKYYKLIKERINLWKSRKGKK